MVQAIFCVVYLMIDFVLMPLAIAANLYSGYLSRKRFERARGTMTRREIAEQNFERRRHGKHADDL
jgi:hypothetical protein